LVFGGADKPGKGVDAKDNAVQQKNKPDRKSPVFVVSNEGDEKVYSTPGSRKGKKRLRYKEN